MTAPAVRLGARLGPFAGCLDVDLVRRFAAATNDPSEDVRAGRVVPPVALVTQIWQAQEAGRSGLISAHLQSSASGGVHGEHDLLLRRPVRPGEPLRTWVEASAARPSGANSLVTLRYTTYDEGDELVAQQWWTTVYLGTSCEPTGAPPPDHRFPTAARDRPLGHGTATIDHAMPTRYAEVSGDWSRHHFDVEAARRSGFDRPFLHGVCTMALCAQTVVATVAEGDPGRLRRVAVRFAHPAFTGDDVVVSVYDGGDGYAFEAKSGGSVVISHGRAELMPS